MWIRWKNEVHLEVVTNYDENNDVADTEQEVFKPNETMEVDVLEDHGDTVDIQFGDGSVAFNVEKTWFEVVNGK
jgi:ubiquinone/menaquinone biosynthesis C-methylase UbiE